MLQTYFHLVSNINYAWVFVFIKQVFKYKQKETKKGLQCFLYINVREDLTTAHIPEPHTSPSSPKPSTHPTNQPQSWDFLRLRQIILLHSILPYRLSGFLQTYVIQHTLHASVSLNAFFNLLLHSSHLPLTSYFHCFIVPELMRTSTRCCCNRQLPYHARIIRIASFIIILFRVTHVMHFKHLITNTFNLLIAATLTHHVTVI